MARLILGCAAFLVLLASGATWLVVTTDHWPWDDRRPPASAVWAFNGALGRFLYEHGQDPPRPRLLTRREELTRAEWSEVQRLMETDPRLKNRIVSSGGLGLKLKPALPLSTGGRRG